MPTSKRKNQLLLTQKPSEIDIIKILQIWMLYANLSIVKIRLTSVVRSGSFEEDRWLFEEKLLKKRRGGSMVAHLTTAVVLGSNQAPSRAMANVLKGTGT